MYFHLSDHVFVSYFKDEAIVLDLKQDKYYIFDEQKTELLKLLLEKEWTQISKGLFDLVKKNTAGNQSLSILNDFITILIKECFLQSILYKEPYLMNKESFSVVGMPHIDWRLPLDGSVKTRLSLPVLKALLMLLKVHMTLKFKGFYFLIKGIKKEYVLHYPYSVPSEEDLNDLVHTLNQACLFYPVRTKCLEWASTLTLLALKKRWRISLSIGVQNYPFLSHAWCQLDKDVIADSPILPEKMAVILTTPLYKETL